MQNEGGFSKLRKVEIPVADGAEVISPTSSGGFSRQGNMTKYNCLCSPTKHAGSFRCRFHRSLQRTKNIYSSEAKSEADTPQPADTSTQNNAVHDVHY